MATTTRQRAAVSLPLARLLARRYGVSDAQIDALAGAAAAVVATAERGRSVSRRPSRRHRARTPSGAPTTRRSDVPTPRDSGRPRRGRGRNLEAHENAFLALLEVSAGAYSSPSPSPSPLRMPLSQSDAVEAALSEVLAQARRGGCNDAGLAMAIASILGRLHSTLRHERRAALLKRLFETSVLDVGASTETAQRSVRTLALSNRALQGAVSLLPLLNRRALLKLLAALTRRFRPEVDGIVARHSAQLFDTPRTSRRERSQRNAQRENASTIAGVFVDLNGLTRDSSRSALSSGSHAPLAKPKLTELARSIAAGAPIVPVSIEACERVDAEVSTAAAAVVQLLRIIAPGPILMHILERTTRVDSVV